MSTGRRLAWDPSAPLSSHQKLLIFLQAVAMQLRTCILVITG